MRWLIIFLNFKQLAVVEWIPLCFSRCNGIGKDIRWFIDLRISNVSGCIALPYSLLENKNGLIINYTLIHNYHISTISKNGTSRSYFCNFVSTFFNTTILFKNSLWKWRREGRRNESFMEENAASRLLWMLCHWHFVIKRKKMELLSKVFFSILGAKKRQFGEASLICQFKLDMSSWNYSFVAL